MLAKSVVFAVQDAANGLPPDIELAFRVLAVVGTVLGAIGAIIALLLKRYWDVRDKGKELEWNHREAESQAIQARQLAKEASRDRLRDILYESLQWFEKGSQKRSIGISIVDASWSLFPEFQSIWLAVLANQAVYLLAVSKQNDDAHEIANLRRIMRVLVREKAHLDPMALQTVSETLDKKTQKKITSGLSIEDADLAAWQEALSVA
jgi:hypothetical protein